MGNGNDFVFIDQSHGGKVSKNKETRRKIRQQAMRDAGLARKQRGGYGQHNLRQYPVFVPPGETTPSTRPLIGGEEEGDDARLWLEWQAVCQWTMPRKLPTSTYEKVRQSVDFDITELAPVVALSFGRGAARALAAEPSKLANLLLRSKTTYLNYVPSRYEANPLLRDVLYCTAAQSRWLLRSQSITPDTAILASYGNALQRLQTALGDPEQCLNPDILCATQLLALFELLKFSRAERWQYHVAGASQIIQKRGPGRFKSEYEKSLFVALIGAIFGEAMMNNDACFLDQDDWKPVFNSLVLDDVDPFSDRSKLCVDLWCALCHVPRLWKAITDLVCHRTEPDPALAMELTLKAYAIRAKLNTWVKKCESQLRVVRTTALFRSQARELIGLCLGVLIVINRFIVSLAPRSSFAIERESQDIAHYILNIKIDPQRQSCSQLFSMRLVFANTTIESRAEWEEACLGATGRANKVVAAYTTAEWEAERRLAEQNTMFKSALVGSPPEWQEYVGEQAVKDAKSVPIDPQLASPLEPVRMKIRDGTREPSRKSSRERPALRTTTNEQPKIRRSTVAKELFEKWCHSFDRKTA